MENQKYLNPKFSHALKDLTQFLGVFEITEDDLKMSKDGLSETSSNLSHITQNMFRTDPKNQLEVVLEKNCSDSEQSDEKNKDILKDSQHIKLAV